MKFAIIFTQAEGDGLVSEVLLLALLGVVEQQEERVWGVWMAESKVLASAVPAVWLL